MYSVFDRDQKTQKFCKKSIEKIKELPASRLESVIGKIEIVGDINKLNRLSSWIRLLCIVLISAITCLFLYVLFVLRDTESNRRLIEIQKNDRRNTSIEAELETWIRTNQEWVYDYMDDPRDSAGPVSLNQRQVEEYSIKIQKIFKNMMISNQLSSDRSSDLEAKTASLISEVLLKLKKYAILKALMILLVILCGARLYFGYMFYRNQETNVFKNVCRLLEIENESYFCKRGYYWSINESMNQLKLTKIYIKVGRNKKNRESTTFEQTQLSISNSLDHQKQKTEILKDLDDSGANSNLSPAPQPQIPDPRLPQIPFMSMQQMAYMMSSPHHAPMVPPYPAHLPFGLPQIPYGRIPAGQAPYHQMHPYLQYQMMHLPQHNTNQFQAVHQQQFPLNNPQSKEKTRSNKDEEQTPSEEEEGQTQQKGSSPRHPQLATQPTPHQGMVPPYQQNVYPFNPHQVYHMYPPFFPMNQQYMMYNGMENQQQMNEEENEQEATETFKDSESDAQDGEAQSRKDRALSKHLSLGKKKIRRTNSRANRSKP